MRTTRGGWVRRLAFAMSLGGLAALAIAGATSARGASTTDSPPPKVFVCKYVGKPGVDERLQTGDNPINPSASSIPGWDGENPGNLVGLEFADAQGRSVVIAIDVGQDEPDVSSCPPPTPPPPTDVCPNIDGNQAEVPDGMVKDEQGNCVTPLPPPTDVCPNIDGNQAEVPDGMVEDEQGNCVTPPPPPTDVCPNIDGNQATAPAGIVKDEQGNCVTPPPPRLGRR